MGSACPPESTASAKPVASTRAAGPGLWEELCAGTGCCTCKRGELQKLEQTRQIATSLHCEDEWEWGRREKKPNRDRDTHREMEKARARVRPGNEKTLRKRVRQ